MKKNILVLLVFVFLLSACHGSSLLNSLNESNPPPGKLFAQIEIESTGDHHHFQSGDYEVYLDEINWVIGNVQFSKSSQARQAHTGEDHGEDPSEDEHEEPTSCSFEGSMNKFVFFDLAADKTLPCILLSEGTYQGVSFEMNMVTAEKRVGTFPENIDYSIQIVGKAIKMGVSHSFEMKSKTPLSISLAKEMNLTAENHHLLVRVDVGEWFHGVKFDELEKDENKMIFFDESHNQERFEHLLEHIKESFTF